MRPKIDSDGYPFVSLCRGPEIIQRKVHRLILETFEGPCPDGMQTRHLNDVHDDNRFSNLYWGTPLENVTDRIINGGYNPAIWRR
jgi:hypothetical protein